MIQSNLSNTKYATRFKKIYNPVNTDEMIKYEQVIEYQYTAAAAGETIIIIPALVGALRIVQMDKELKPVAIANFTFNPGLGRINLINGITLEAEETLYILYAILVTS